MRKRMLAVALAFLLVLSPHLSVSLADELDEIQPVSEDSAELDVLSEPLETEEVSEVLDQTLSYIYNTVREPAFGSGAGEWSVLALARGDYPVAAGYYDGYYEKVVSAVQKAVAEPRNEGLLDYYKSSEYSRLILALTAIGRDVTDVGGINLLDGLSDLTYVKKQGINGPIFALLALDSGAYEIPTAGEGKTQTTRPALVEDILKQQQTSGAWGLSTSYPSVDLTAMALQALAPYYNSDEAVKTAVDKALTYLSSQQNESGDFEEFGSSNSQSLAQTVMALSALGIDAKTYEPLMKNGNSVLSALLTYVVPDGGFYHMKTMSNVNGMATDQAGMALVAYSRFIAGKSSLYDMTDVEAVLQPEQPSNPSNPDHSSEEPQDEMMTIVIAVEKFALGQGYYMSPIEVEIPKGANLAETMVDAIGADRVRYAGSFEENFFFTELYDPASQGALTTAPQFIADAAGTFEDNPDEWLGSMDFTSTSGWLFTVNGESPMVGMSDYELADGDVVRLQFSLYEWGKDIGHGWDGSLIEPANKEALTALLAKVNSNMLGRLTEDHVLGAYEEAIAFAKDFEASQAQVDESVAKLLAALDKQASQESSQESSEDTSLPPEEESSSTTTTGTASASTENPKTTGASNDKANTNKEKAPKTGDEGILHLAVLGLGAGGVLLVTFLKKKKDLETK